MKNIIFVFGAFFLSFLWGCKDETLEKRIICQARQLSEAHPDSSLAMLDSISLPEEMSAVLATEWSLLYVRSADKIGEEMPYVSQIQVALQIADYNRAGYICSY